MPNKMTPNQGLRQANKKLEEALVVAVADAKRYFTYHMEEKERANNAEHEIAFLRAIITKLTEK